MGDVAVKSSAAVEVVAGSRGPAAVEPKAMVLLVSASSGRIPVAEPSTWVASLRFRARSLATSGATVGVEGVSGFVGVLDAVRVLRIIGGFAGVAGLSGLRAEIVVAVFTAAWGGSGVESF